MRGEAWGLALDALSVGVGHFCKGRATCRKSTHADLKTRNMPRPQGRVNLTSSSKRAAAGPAPTAHRLDLARSDGTRARSS